MLKIIMLRHGKTEGNSLGKYIGVTDEDLMPTETKALENLRFPSVDGVYSSPMKRCLQTAGILFPALKPTVFPELSECDFGRFEGKTYQELIGDPVYQSWVESGEIEAFPGGEKRTDFQARCIRGLEKTIAHAVKKRWGSIAMVVHGGTIMSLLDAYGFPEQDYNRWHVGNGEGFVLRMAPEFFEEGAAAGRKIIVDRKIERY